MQVGGVCVASGQMRAPPDDRGAEPMLGRSGLLCGLGEAGRKIHVGSQRIIDRSMGIEEARNLFRACVCGALLCGQEGSHDGEKAFRLVHMEPMSGIGQGFNLRFGEEGMDGGVVLLLDVRGVFTP